MNPLRPRLGWLPVLMALILGAAGCAYQPSSASTQPAAAHPAVSGCQAGAEGYLDWLDGCLAGLEKDVPSIVNSAQHAAKLYVDEGYELGACGGDPFTREVFNRSGGMMGLLAFEKFVGNNRKPSPARKSIVMLGLREDRIEDLAARSRQFRQDGCYVIAFGRAALVERARRQGAQFDEVIDTHASPSGGLVPGQAGRWLLPTDSVASSCASWLWVGEFVASCTRLGKMPPVYMGYVVDGAFERERKYKGLRFHDSLYEKMPVGKASSQFLAALRGSLRKVRSSELTGVRQAASQALAARRAGGKLSVYLQGHTLLHLMGYPNDPGFFEPIHYDWNTLRKDAAFKSGDFILCVGYDVLYQGEKWQFMAERARKAGTKLAWSITDYHKNEVDAAAAAGEVIIRQYWGFGDSVVEIKGYDVKMLPTSGIIAEAVVWMVHADMLKLMNATADQPATAPYRTSPGTTATSGPSASPASARAPAGR